jgi:hypothetical protein
MSIILPAIWYCCPFLLSSKILLPHPAAPKNDTFQLFLGREAEVDFS